VPTLSTLLIGLATFVLESVHPDIRGIRVVMEESGIQQFGIEQSGMQQFGMEQLVMQQFGMEQFVIQQFVMQQVSTHTHTQFINARRLKPKGQLLLI
jgi:hypothetical protein